MNEGESVGALTEDETEVKNTKLYRENGKQKSISIYFCMTNGHFIEVELCLPSVGTNQTNQKSIIFTNNIIQHF